jgi:hypothetical protein
MLAPAGCHGADAVKEIRIAYRAHARAGPMIQNKIVVRYQDGRIRKGQTGDFLPTKPVFHLTPADAAADTKPVEVQVAEVKAIFFVKDFAGNPERKKA